MLILLCESEMVEFSTILQFIQAGGIIVGVAYYIMNIENNRKNQKLQLETRQAQLFMQIYAEQLKRGNIPGYDVVYHMEFDSPEEFEEKYGRENNPEAWYDFWLYNSYYEGIGVLVRENLVDIKLVALLNGGEVISGWEKFEKVTNHYRAKYHWPRWSIEWEYLYTTMKEYALENPELQIITS